MVCFGCSGKELGIIFCKKPFFYLEKCGSKTSLPLTAADKLHLFSNRRRSNLGVQLICGCLFNWINKILVLTKILDLGD